MEILETIERAISTGDTLKIKYHGGSQPGAVREIVPTATFGDKVRAECLASGQSKVFKLDRLELCEAGQPSYHERGREPEFHSLKDVAARLRDTLDGNDWHIHFESAQDSGSLTLHRAAMDGRPVKSFEAGLFFERFSDDDVLEFRLDKHGASSSRSKVERSRPYILRAGDQPPRVYSDLDKAAARLLEITDALFTDRSKRG